MKAKVIGSFTDKYTGSHHDAGSEIDVSKERLAEINGTPAGVLVEEIKKATKK
jgi:hypothetical protein